MPLLESTNKQMNNRPLFRGSILRADKEVIDRDAQLWKLVDYHLTSCSGMFQLILIMMDDNIFINTAGLGSWESRQLSTPSINRNLVLSESHNHTINPLDPAWSYIEMYGSHFHTWLRALNCQMQSYVSGCFYIRVWSPRQKLAEC